MAAGSAGSVPWNRPDDHAAGELLGRPRRYELRACSTSPIVGPHEVGVSGSSGASRVVGVVEVEAVDEGLAESTVTGGRRRRPRGSRTR